MRPDLVVEPQAACDLLYELGRVGRLAAVEVLVLRASV
jgi:hypothetical protein